MNEKKELKFRKDNNLWDDFEEFLEVYKLMKEKKWFWSMNMKCKYVDLRIDMRDGKCLIMDRDGNRILPSQLKYQFADLNNLNKG